MGSAEVVAPGDGEVVLGGAVREVGGLVLAAKEDRGFDSS